MSASNFKSIIETVFVGDQRDSDGFSPVTGDLVRLPTCYKLRRGVPYGTNRVLR